MVDLNSLYNISMYFLQCNSRLYFHLFVTYFDDSLSRTSQRREKK